jgi:hypothetical protein
MRVAEDEVGDRRIADAPRVFRMVQELQKRFQVPL